MGRTSFRRSCLLPCSIVPISFWTAVGRHFAHLLGVAALVAARARLHRVLSKRTAGLCRVVLEAAAVAASFTALRGALPDSRPCAGLVRIDTNHLADCQPAVPAEPTAFRTEAVLIHSNILQGTQQKIRWEQRIQPPKAASSIFTRILVLVQNKFEFVVLF